MKLAKALRTKTKKELTNAKMEANKKARTEYNHNRKMVTEEFEAVINFCNPYNQDE
jgi:hypothetical protein